MADEVFTRCVEEHLHKFMFGLPNKIRLWKFCDAGDSYSCGETRIREVFFTYSEETLKYLGQRNRLFKVK